MNDKVAACLVDVFADVNMLMLAVLCGKKKYISKMLFWSSFAPKQPRHQSMQMLKMCQSMEKATIFSLQMKFFW